MARLNIYEILDSVDQAKTKKEKITILTQNNTLGLRDVLKGAFDTRIQFLIPEGAPPYDVAPSDARMHLDVITRKMGLFVRGAHEARINKAKVQQAFINMLGTVHPKDAEVLIMMKDKAMEGNYKGLTKKLVQEAFPGLIRE